MAPSLRSMRYFVTALNRGSLSKASEDLHVAASAISSAIDQIEAHFQLKLTVRQRARGIEATADGKVMAQKFASLLEDYEAILQAGSDLRESFGGEFRIGYYSPVAPAFLPEILKDILSEPHAATLHLSACNNIAAQEGLLSGDFDAILFVSDRAIPQIDFTPLVEAPAYCLLAADHPLASRQSLRLRDLAAEDVVSLDRPMAADYYRRLFEIAGQRPKTIAYANSTEMVRSLVGARKACAILNMVPRTEISYAGDRLAALPIKDDLPSLTLSVGYRRDRPRRIVTEFVTRCRAYFATPRHVLRAGA